MARTQGARTRVWTRQPKARDRIWQAMRTLRRFDVPALAASAEAGRANVTKYLRGLARAGYLVVIRAKRNGAKGGHAIYQLVRDSGPRAPRLQADGTTFDPNTHEVHNGGLPQ